MSWIEIIVAIIAGWGAGVVTGFVGASAAVTVVPMLAIFLGVSPYVAIGVSLGTDVVCSLVSTIGYARHRNVDYMEGLIMAAATMSASQIGSYLSSGIPAQGLGRATGIIILVMGISFMRKPISTRVLDLKERINLSYFEQNRRFWGIVMGLIIGLISGFTGAGGGEAMFIIMVFILGYQVHIAVGTSVMIMTFTALSGLIGHALYAPVPIGLLIFSWVGGATGAAMAATYANRVSEDQLSKVAGACFVVLGALMTIDQLITGGLI
ncbi:MAG: sulfite exporter TauE/SafE family protein [Candidatus Thermoplasmatota archaeon]|nr:sulfite exporter TauE/SafE family protein [Candidatus Thermoplasmatota archaeon]